MVSAEQIAEERKAWEDWSERVARNDPDWTFYPPGTTRPTLPWWRRLLKV